MLTGSDVPTLFVIEVIIVGVALDVIIGRRSGPMNTNFNVVVIECHERDGTLGSFTKEEPKRVKIRSSAHTWMCSVRTLGNILGERIDGNLFREDRILGINQRPPDIEFHFIDDRVPSLNVEGLGGIVDREIDITEKVSRSFELNAGHRIVFHCSMDSLFFDGL